MRLERIIEAALFTPTDRGWGLPLLFWGDPGVGKSQVIRAVAARVGLRCETLSPGERGEAAFGVVPVPQYDADGRTPTAIGYPAPEWALPLMAAERGLVFVDELTTAAPAVAPALLGLTLDKRVGGVQLPGGVRILAAANPPDRATSGYDLTPPQANRLGHVTWDPPGVPEWVSWLTGGDAETAAAPSVALAREAAVAQKWPGAHARAKGLVGAFLRARPGLLHAMPDVAHPDASRAWPSPRSWSYATRAIAAGDVHELGDVDADVLVSGFVGEGAAAEFWTFRTEQDMPDPEGVLDGAIAFVPDPCRLDRTFAVLGACVALVTPPKAPRRDARCEMLAGILMDVVEDAPDIVQPAVVALARAGFRSAPTMQDVLVRFGRLLDVK